MQSAYNLNNWSSKASTQIHPLVINKNAEFLQINVVLFYIWFTTSRIKDGRTTAQTIHKTPSLSVFIREYRNTDGKIWLRREFGTKSDFLIMRGCEASPILCLFMSFLYTKLLKVSMRFYFCIVGYSLKFCEI